MDSRIMTANDVEVGEWMKKIGIDSSTCRRLIIDIQVGNVVVVYEERYGDERIFQIEPPPEIKAAITECKKDSYYHEVAKKVIENVL